MKSQQAANVLQALVKGVHPITGADLPSNAIVHEAVVMRALLAGIAALEAHVTRETRRKSLPPSIGKPWSEEEKAIDWRVRKRLAEGCDRQDARSNAESDRISARGNGVNHES